VTGQGHVTWQQAAAVERVGTIAHLDAAEAEVGAGAEAAAGCNSSSSSSSSQTVGGQQGKGGGREAARHAVLQQLGRRVIGIGRAIANVATRTGNANVIVSGTGSGNGRGNVTGTESENVIGRGKVLIRTGTGIETGNGPGNVSGMTADTGGRTTGLGIASGSGSGHVKGAVVANVITRPDHAAGAGETVCLAVSSGARVYIGSCCSSRLPWSQAW
jgi:hypothetical protein